MVAPASHAEHPPEADNLHGLFVVSQPPLSISLPAVPAVSRYARRLEARIWIMDYRIPSI
jgi:hypothetical protein